MRASASLDTNVVLRYLLNDHAEHSPRATILFQALRLDEIEVFCPATVVFETIHVLNRSLSIARPAVAQALSDLVSYPGFRLEHHTAIINALSFWADQPSLDFADCYHLALTKTLDMSRIYTFDRKMDRYPGVERIEP